MTLTIDLAPQTEAWISAEARHLGVRPVDVIQRILNERAASISPSAQSAPIVDAENAAAIAMLDKRLVDEATDDPEEIAQAEEELAELKRNMNANRAVTGERLVFP